MKNTTKNLLLATALLSTYASAQSYNGGTGWTSARANETSICSHAQLPVSCAVNLSYRLANTIFPHVSYEVYGDTFLPILQAAAATSDALADLGPWSLETRNEVLNLVALLEIQESEINKLMSTPAHFAIARKLKSTIRIIKRELN